MIEKKSIGLQLYTVREALQADYEGTIRKIASFGYSAVETAGMFGDSPKSARALFDSLGLVVAAAHAPLPIGEKKNEVLDTIGILGCEYVILPSLDRNKYFKSLDGIKEACDLLNEGNSNAQSAGLILAYHNHEFEMTIIEGRPAYEYMLEYLDDTVMFELDTYWAKVGGQDPLHVIAEMSGRLPLLHIKDGPADERESAHTALGAGNMDIPAILDASPAKWHIVELDACDTDMIAAVEQSCTYLEELLS